jgi:hypothetical protein
MKSMMVLAAAVVAMTTLSACQPKNAMAPGQSGIHSTKMAGGLCLTLDTQRRNLVRGQSLILTATAKNTSASPMEIVAVSGAPVIVTIARKTASGWETVKTYPENTTQVTDKWTLAAGAERKFPMTLPIAIELPTGEPLRLEAKLNGRPDVVAGGYIQIFLDASTCNRAGIYEGTY